MHWSERFLNVGYERGAQGPLNFDCWSYFRWVQREQFGRDVPFMPSPASRGSIVKAMPEWAASFGWAAVETPDTGDAVFLSFLKHPTHVGAWVGDIATPSILHCPEGGAVLHTRFHLKSAGWMLRGFYRFTGAA